MKRLLILLCLLVRITAAAASEKMVAPCPLGSFLDGRPHPYGLRVWTNDLPTEVNLATSCRKVDDVKGFEGTWEARRANIENAVATPYYRGEFTYKKHRYEVRIDKLTLTQRSKDGEPEEDFRAYLVPAGGKAQEITVAWHSVDRCIPAGVMFVTGLGRIRFAIGRELDCDKHPALLNSINLHSTLIPQQP